MEIFDLGTTVHFDPDVCGPCPLREHCTHAASGSGRSLSIAEDEDAQKSFGRLQGSRAGRAALRERVAVEHSLAHISGAQRT